MTNINTEGFNSQLFGCNDSGQVGHPHVPLSPSSILWYGPTYPHQLLLSKATRYRWDFVPYSILVFLVSNRFHVCVCYWVADCQWWLLYLLYCRDVHEAFFVRTEARPRPWSLRSRPSPRRWQFKPRWDRDRGQGLQSSRPRWGIPTPRRDRAEALLHLETAWRPRHQDWGHIPVVLYHFNH